MYPEGREKSELFNKCVCQNEKDLVLNVFNRLAARKKLSIIIPVYNAEKYLDDCLISILDQVDSKVEIIAIDDASEDRSYEILLKYRKLNPCLTVLQNKINLGPGATRNHGMNLAMGEYIAFLDSDDTVNETYFYDLLCSAEKNKSDIVFSNIEPESFVFNKFYEKYSPVSTSLDNLPAECRMTGIIGKLFRKKFLKEKSIKFLNEKIIIGEDIPFTWFSYLCAKKISFAPRAIYNYRMHGTGCDSVNDERILGIFKALKHVQFIYNKLDPCGAREHLIICLMVNQIEYNYTKLVKTANPNTELINKYKT